MAKGMKCRICGGYMYAQREDDQPKGRWVYYVCRATSCTNTEKVFEKYPRRIGAAASVRVRAEAAPDAGNPHNHNIPGASSASPRRGSAFCEPDRDITVGLVGDGGTPGAATERRDRGWRMASDSACAVGGHRR